MIYEFILIHLDKPKKRNKLSRIHLKMGGFAKVCFGYKVVICYAMTTVQPKQTDDNKTTNENNFRL